MEHSLESRILGPQCSTAQGSGKSQLRHKEETLGLCRALRMQRKDQCVCGKAIPLNDAQRSAWYTMVSEFEPVVTK